MPADFAKLYDMHRKRVQDMTDEELENTRQEAADIAHNARIIQIAATEETNTRRAKNKKWTVPSNGSTPDMEAVVERKKRQTKNEKMTSVLKDLGIANAADILASLDKGTVTPTVRVDLNSIEIKEKKTFDPASLSFMKK